MDVGGGGKNGFDFVLAILAVEGVRIGGFGFMAGFGLESSAGSGRGERDRSEAELDCAGEM